MAAITDEVQKPNDATLIVTRMLNATPERVFSAWTAPEQIKKWMHPDPEMSIQQVIMDVRAGGKFRIQMQKSDGEFFTAVGVFKEVKAPERLVYTWDWEKDGSGTEFGEVEGKITQVTVEFLKRGNQTQLVLTHSLFAAVQSRDNHAQGWSELVASFAKFVEN